MKNRKRSKAQGKENAALCFALFPPVGQTNRGGGSGESGCFVNFKTLAPLAQSVGPKRNIR